MDLLSEAIERARTAPALSTLEAGDLEDALGSRLEGAGVEDAWEVAPALASAGVDQAWLDRVIKNAGEDAPDAIRWLSIGLDIESLVSEISNSAGRISQLVSAMKDYSHLDKGRSPKSTSTRASTAHWSSSPTSSKGASRWSGTTTGPCP